MCSNSESIRGFEELMHRVEPLIRARGGRVVGAALGNLLRQVDPEFDAATYGAARLVELLESVPAVGRVERGARDEDVLFVLAGVASAPDRGRARATRLHRQLWNALVAATPKHDAYVDLATGRVVYTDVGSTPDGADHDEARFVAVPAIPQEEMQGWAAAFARDAGNEEAAERVLALDPKRWFPDFVRALPADVRPLWLVEHQRLVAEHWSEWADAQRVDRRRGLHGGGHRARPPQPADSAADDTGDIEELRALVHGAVDEMGMDELLSLPLPLRYVWQP